MNRTQLAEALSQQTGLSLTQAHNVAKMGFDMMADALASGERVEIRGFGSFSIRHYGAYEGRNPKTGEVIKVKPKKMPYFKCGKELKDRVDIYKERPKEEIGKIVIDPVCPVKLPHDDE